MRFSCSEGPFGSGFRQLGPLVIKIHWFDVLATKQQDLAIVVSARLRFVSISRFLIRSGCISQLEAAKKFTKMFG